MPVKRQTAGPSVPTQKRTRFTSSPPAGTKAGDINDDLLEEDLPENAAQSKARSRKQLKDQDGYGSDSSNDEEGVVPSRRADAKEDEDDDVDMFADDVEEKEKEKAKGKGKEKEFMDLNDITGQEFGQDEEENEGYDSEAERQRRKVGLDGDMGIDIIPFNMKAEMEEGRFTADGETYIANDKDPNEKHDVWLEGMDDDAILKAREAHKERERLERVREEREEKGLEGGKGEQDKLMRIAVDLMERGETVLEALQRLGKEVEDKRKREEAGAKKKTWAEKQKERKAAAAQEAQQA
jgi:CD2 antigen cytoplasmic tail-binding protein 2